MKRNNISSDHTPLAWKRIAHKQPNGLTESAQSLSHPYTVWTCDRTWKAERAVIGAIPLTSYPTDKSQASRKSLYLLSEPRAASVFHGREEHEAATAAKMPKSFLVKNKKGRLSGSTSLSEDEGTAAEKHCVGKANFSVVAVRMS